MKEMIRKRLQLIPPGEILLREFMLPLGLSINRLSREIHLAPNRIRSITQGKSAITEDIAVRLGMYFGMTQTIWHDLQIDYDQRLRAITQSKS
jgi:addiction module HigA family antidote